MFGCGATMVGSILKAQKDGDVSCAKLLPCIKKEDADKKDDKNILGWIVFLMCLI